MLEQINKAFIELDAKMLERQTVWAMERFDTLKARMLEKREKGQPRVSNAERYEISGGKGHWLPALSLIHI